jgi:DNA-cytosine methyltransferase
MWLDTRGNTVLNIAICDRCKMKRAYSDMSDDGNIRGLRVCNQGCSDERDPYRLPARPTEKISVRFPRPDVFIGGPPCQGFSTIGQNDHLDERNFLFLEFLRIVEALKPDYIIVENVTGLLSKRNENVLKAIIKSFTDLGYTIDVKVLSAHHYGVPEKRRRTIFLGNRFGVKNIYPDKIFKDSDQDLQDLPLSRTVGWAFDNLLKSNGEILNHDIKRSQIANDLERKRIIINGFGEKMEPVILQK